MSFLAAVIAGCSPANKQDSTTITVWHWMSDRDDAFQELAKQFESERHIQVKFELYAPSESYAQRVKASAQTNTLPDIYGILGEKRDFASFIKSGYVANLAQDLDVKFYERFEFETNDSKEFEMTLSKTFDCIIVNFTYNHRQGDTFFFVFRLKSFPKASFGMTQSYNRPKASSQRL